MVDDTAHPRGRAVEPPRVRIELELGPRRHRYLTAPSSLLVFACVFLPAMRGCDAPIYPTDEKVLLAPYFYALAFAIVALAATTRRLRSAITVLRALVIVELGVAAVAAFVTPPIGFIELLCALWLFGVLGYRGHSERRAAAALVVIATLDCIMFGLLAATGQALAGIYLAAAGSVGMLVGGLAWHAEASRRATSLVLPRAITRR